MSIALLGAAVVFALVTGANEGATLVAMATCSGGISVLAAAVELTAATFAVPLMLGGRVATTLAHGLVSFEDSGGRLAFLAAVVVALVVVGLLSRRGLPTSLTLALAGGIVGVGIGARLPLAWSTVAVVLVAGLIGPLVASLGGFLLAPAAQRLLSGHLSRQPRTRRLQRLAFLVESFAYAANSGEKMLAVMAVATGASLDPVHAGVPSQLVEAVCFGAGTLLAVRRVSRRITGRMVRARPAALLAAVLAFSAASLGGSELTLPLSSTQLATSSLLGATGRLAPHRIRWEQAIALVGAWFVTLPAAVALGALAGLPARALR